SPGIVTDAVLAPQFLGDLLKSVIQILRVGIVKTSAAHPSQVVKISITAIVFFPRGPGASRVSAWITTASAGPTAARMSATAADASEYAAKDAAPSAPPAGISATRISAAPGPAPHIRIRVVLNRINQSVQLLSLANRAFITGMLTGCIDSVS